VSVGSLSFRYLGEKTGTVKQRWEGRQYFDHEKRAISFSSGKEIHRTFGACADVKNEADRKESLMRIKPFMDQAQAPFIASGEVPPPARNELDAVFKAVSVARALNDLSPANDFSVIRDPRTGVVVIAIRHRATGELIDLCLPGALLEILEHLPGPWKGMEE